MASADSRKQLGNNSGNGPGRPVGSNGTSSKMSVGSTGNKSSTPGVKNHVNGMPKSLPLKTHPPVSRQSMEQKFPRQNVEHRNPRQGMEQRNPRHMEQRIPRQSMEQRIPRPSNEQRIPRQSMDQRNPRPSLDQRNPRPSLDQRNSRQSMEQRKDIRELNRPKMIPKQPVASSKPQVWCYILFFTYTSGPYIVDFYLIYI